MTGLTRCAVSCALLALVSAGCGQPADPPAAGGDAAPATAAESTPRQVLAAYFSLLQEGRYAEAVPLYGGSYEVMQGWNPGIAPDDSARLFEAACEGNGLMCLPLERIVFALPDGGVDSIYHVSFRDQDGARFVRGPCCGATEEEMPSESIFPYRVARVGGSFRVMDLPVYVP